FNPAGEATAPSAYAGGMAHLRTASTVDLFGNKLEATNYGCVGGSECPGAHGLPVDEHITQVTDPELLEHGSGWMWRTGHSYVEGNVNTSPRNETFTTFDELGRPVKTDAVLT